MARAVLTGASGFIGRHVHRLLLDAGWDVRPVTRASAPPLEAPQPDAWVVGLDIGPDTDWSPVLERADYVVHLAGVAHHRRDCHHQEPATAFHRVNAEGTARLAGAVRDTPGLGRLLYISSVAVHGSVSQAPLRGDSPIAPDTCYGRSKAAAEDALRTILSEGRPDWCILRPPLVYGPGNPGNMARLQALARRRLPMPLGSIHNHRSFMYVGNLAAAILAALRHPRASRQRFTVSDGPPLSTSDLYHLTCEIHGLRARTFWVPRWALVAAGRCGDLLARTLGREVGVDSYSVSRLVNSIWVDPAPLHEALSWHPPYSVREGLEATLGIGAPPTPAPR